MIGICGRCLNVIDARSSIVAVKGDEQEPFEESRRARELKSWAAQKITHGWTIQVDDTTRRFEQVTTWNGDPVCEFHLWYLADRERRNA